jgi:hypothetical protein
MNCDNIWVHPLHKLIPCHLPGGQKPQNRPNKRRKRRLKVKFLEKMTPGQSVKLLKLQAFQELQSV